MGKKEKRKEKKADTLGYKKGTWEESIGALLKKHGTELLLRSKYANKATYGKLLILAGSIGMAGAAYLCGLSAYRTGIGMVKYLGTEENRTILQTLLPEAMYESWEIKKGAPQYNKGRIIDVDKLRNSLDWSDYVIIGPGLSKDKTARELLGLIFEDEFLARLHLKKLVVADADALNIIAEEGYDLKKLGCIMEQGKCSNAVITPHIGEMKRLAPNADTMDLLSAEAERISDRCNINIVLKSYETTIYTLNSSPFKLSPGCAAMAKAGSGDVLCGFIAGTTAVLNGDVEDALSLAVYLHGAAGHIAAVEKGEHGVIASDIAQAAGRAIDRCFGL